MKRVLIVVHDFPPHGGGGVMRALKFAKYLPSFGWEPTVVTAHPQVYDPELLDSKLVQEIEGVHIQRLWYPNKGMARSQQAPNAAPQPKPSPGARLRRLARGIVVPDLQVPWVLPAFSAVRRLHHAEPFDVLLTTSPPNSTHLVGLLTKRFLGLPWVMDYRDQWCGNPLYKTAPWRDRLESRLEAACLKQADSVVTATGPMADYYRSIVKQESVELITNGFDSEDFRGLNADFPATFTVSYVGSISHTRSPLPFLRAWGEFLRRHNLSAAHAACHLVGPAYGLDLARAIAEPDLRSTVSYRPFVAHHEALAEMTQASLLLLLTSDGEGGATVLTGKLFEYMAAAKPILAVAPAGALSDLLCERRLGKAFSHDDEAGIVAHLEDMYALHLRGELPNLVAGRNVEDFERRTLCSRLAEVFDRMTEQAVEGERLTAEESR